MTVTVKTILKAGCAFVFSLGVAVSASAQAKENGYKENGYKENVYKENVYKDNVYSAKKALVGGTLVDGLGGAPIYDSVVLIDGNKIIDIGEEGKLAIPDGYEVISTEAMTVMPGLWEMHAHLMLAGHSDYAHWDKTYIDRLGSEIMPASAEQLLLAGVTTARDLGAPLDDSISVKRRIAEGEIAGPRLFVSGPFIQDKAYPGTEAFRWGVNSPADGRAKVRRLAKAGVDVIKLIDQDVMARSEVEAVVDEAHKQGLKVVGHSHKPDEIRIGLEVGIDNFEHTGLTTSPEYPADIMEKLKERTAKGRIAGGPLYWTPTVEGLWNFEETRDNPEDVDSDCWHRGLKPDTIADIKASIQHQPGRFADIIAIKGDALKYPALFQHVDMVVKDGVVYKKDGQPVEENF